MYQLSDLANFSQGPLEKYLKSINGSDHLCGTRKWIPHANLCEFGMVPIDGLKDNSHKQKNQYSAAFLRLF